MPDGNKPIPIRLLPSGDSVGGQILNIRTVGRLYGEFANCYGELADDYILIGGLAIISIDSELESADSSADSNADPPKIGVWVRAFNVLYRFQF